ncbi:conserved hypothetical protein [Ricinus communis]|uniref:Aminotransferase-like plant mobile domain-containing protein n=1 Tax=Ricinus communis TaxID=3988 RepID=B9SRF0_RICCO|nr:conserved hypothetical protein [Ricinus communis]
MLLLTGLPILGCKTPIFILCSTSGKLSLEFLPLAKGIVSSKTCNALVMLLASTYQSLDRMVTEHPLYKVGNHMWIVQLWLLAYFSSLRNKQMGVSELDIWSSSREITWWIKERIIYHREAFCRKSSKAKTYVPPAPTRRSQKNIVKSTFINFVEDPLEVSGDENKKDSEDNKSHDPSDSDDLIDGKDAGTEMDENPIDIEYLGNHSLP